MLSQFFVVNGILIGGGPGPPDPPLATPMFQKSGIFFRPYVLARHYKDLDYLAKIRPWFPLLFH